MTEQSSIQPRYEVEQVDEMVTRTLTRFEHQRDEDGKIIRGKGHFVYEEIEEPFGYMVYFPSGHSLRVRTTEELRRLGFHKQAGLVDMETGEVIKPDEEVLSLKDRVLRKTSAKSSRAPRVM